MKAQAMDYRIAGRHWKLDRGVARNRFFLGLPEGTSPANILILNFWPLELRENKFLV
jgi:hypothetical protein